MDRLISDVDRVTQRASDLSRQHIRAVERMQQSPRADSWRHTDPIPSGEVSEIDFNRATQQCECLPAVALSKGLSSSDERPPGELIVALPLSQGFILSYKALDVV
jgi:hypothetical protein